MDDFIGALVGSVLADRLDGRRSALSVFFEERLASLASALQQGEGFLVVQRELLRVDALARGLFDQVDRAAEDGQIAQAEEIHLQQTNIFNILHIVLSNDFLLRNCVCHRNVIADITRSDNNTGSMLGSISIHSFKNTGVLYQFLNLRFFRIFYPFQFRYICK